jgi:hypothetical protein
MQDGRQAVFHDFLFGPGRKTEGIDGRAEIDDLGRV